MTMLTVVAACSGVPPERAPERTPSKNATEPVVAAKPDASSETKQARPAAGLTARFEAPAAAFASTTSGASLAFVVVNEGTTPAEIDLDQLGSAILGIDVFGADGDRIATIPPGMPPANYQPRVETLAPGASHRFVVDLNVFSPPLPAGTYTAKVRGDRIASEPVRFEIKG
jgi:hypothetical protein